MSLKRAIHHLVRDDNSQKKQRGDDEPYVESNKNDPDLGKTLGTDDNEYDNDSEKSDQSEVLDIVAGHVSTLSDASEDNDSDLEELVFGTRKKKLNDEKENNVGFFIDKSAGGAEEKSNAAWVDEDDEEITDIKDTKPRGMGNMRFQPLMAGNRKAEYEKAVGEAPAWSALPDLITYKNENDLLTTHFKYIGDAERLPGGVLDFHKCCDANKQQLTQGPLEACEFHTSAQIALTAGTDCRVSLFQVDGKNNPKIHSFFTEKFPINCAHFLASGEEIVMTSDVHYFFSYDLISGKITKIPYIKGTDDRKLRKFYVSPDKKHLLFASRFGQMHIVSASTKELVKSIKVNGFVTDAAFRNDGQQFLTFGEEGVVTLWDIRTQGCVHSFTDEGCTFGTSLSVSPNGQYIACGSSSGIVNLYDETCLAKTAPTPIKAFKNLQYSTYCLRFNSTSEILAMASSEADNAVKLVHVPSLTVFNNFPGFKIRYLKLIRRMDFSPNSGYMMLGNQRGRAMLFRLDHYKSF